MDHGMMMGGDGAGDNGFCSGTGRVMLPGFQRAADGGPCIIYLFEGGVVDTETKYAVAIAFTVLLALTVEAIRWFRTHLTNRDMKFAKFIGDGWMDLLSALLYACQMCIAYWIMLLVMLYEFVMFTAILVGLAAGHWLFRRIDRKYFPASEWLIEASGTPCCNGGARA